LAETLKTQLLQVKRNLQKLHHISKIQPVARQDSATNLNVRSRLRLLIVAYVYSSCQ
jgi:hypothetical protein